MDMLYSVLYTNNFKGVTYSTFSAAIIACNTTVMHSTEFILKYDQNVSAAVVAKPMFILNIVFADNR
jgi:hypothetical protein